MNDHDIEVFYDGDCPLCGREIAMLRRLDRRQRIRFVDIAAPGFDASAMGASREALMARIHGRLPDGRSSRVWRCSAGFTRRWGSRRWLR